MTLAEWLNYKLERDLKRFSDSCEAVKKTFYPELYPENGETAIDKTIEVLDSIRYEFEQEMDKQSNEPEMRKYYQDRVDALKEAIKRLCRS